jgi:hypothetical protein
MKMKIIHVYERDIKSITEFILEKKLIFHPVISPDGNMNFTSYDDKEYVLLLDRNLLTKMVEFFKNGVLKDSYIRKVIGSIVFWAHLNSVSLNSGLALNEYANHKEDNRSASEENNIFLKAMNFYSPEVWLDIATERRELISPLPDIPNEGYQFNVVNEHQLMHMSEMFCITRLYFDKSLYPADKMIKFLEWNFTNLLICQYTIFYAMIVFSGKSKVFRKVEPNNLDIIFKICKNQAWDLTYLSDWSTLYWDDKEGDTVYLFATMDKELKQLFIETHDIESNPFSKFFSDIDAIRIENVFNELKRNRKKPNLNSEIIKDFYESEYRLLAASIKNFS